ncbi:MAG: Na/Pi cotransporter family protein [Clostridiales bacterium]|nr:Na/Pi cotransporter family protein [Clostridiales bacterium]
MGLNNIFILCGGLAFFLYGMHVMSHGLQKMAGSKLEKTLKSLTSNPIKGIAVGMVITVAIQSSSAMTVMLVGLVNSSLIELSQTIPIILGSNIGTTLTTWLFSFAGVTNNNVFLLILKPEALASIIALVCVIIIKVAKGNRRKDIASIVLGFAILMIGLTQISYAVTPLADELWFTDVFLVMLKNPIFGIVTGTVLSALIQSSAASIGILQAISLTGTLTVGVAIPIIMGQNIGTCVTALISAMGTDVNAKRVAAAHTYIKIISTLIFLPTLYIINRITNGVFGDKYINPVGIALFHSIYNIAMTLILLPFSKMILRLTEITIREKKDNNLQKVFLDDRLLTSPSFAVIESQNITNKMARLSHDTVITALELLDSYDEKKYRSVKTGEDMIDDYEDKLGTFLVKISSREMTIHDSDQVTKLLQTIGYLERISDHALNIAQIAEEMRDKELSFSDEARVDIGVMIKALREVLSISINAFIENDTKSAKRVEPLEQVIDKLREEIKARHIERLKKGQCTIELGFILADLLGNLERISDHCSNIAVCMIEIQASVLNQHSYLSKVRKSEIGQYSDDYKTFEEKYRLN